MQISSIDEEARDLVEDRIERKSFAALSREYEPSGKQCHDPGCFKV